jgi:hypothetical protein
MREMEGNNSRRVNKERPINPAISGTSHHILSHLDHLDYLRYAEARLTWLLRDDAIVHSRLLQTHPISTMFRTAVRRFAATALRPAETVAQMEAPQLHGIEISKAQRIAHDGFIDGALTLDSFSLYRG